MTASPERSKKNNNFQNVGRSNVCKPMHHARRHFCNTSRAGVSWMTPFARTTHPKFKNNGNRKPNYENLVFHSRGVAKNDIGKQRSNRFTEEIQSSNHTSKKKCEPFWGTTGFHVPHQILFVISMNRFAFHVFLQKGLIQTLVFRKTRTITKTFSRPKICLLGNPTIFNKNILDDKTTNPLKQTVRESAFFKRVRRNARDRKVRTVFEFHWKTPKRLKAMDSARIKPPDAKTAQKKVTIAIPCIYDK